MKRIYMDNNATTPVDPAVLQALLPYYQGHFGNASSIHWAGREARRAVDRAREQVAQLVGCRPGEIVFTSCGTEADNMALRGVLASWRERGNHLITTQVEHPAVLETCRDLERTGQAQVTYLPVDSQGRLDLDMLLGAIRPDTVCISVMFANNEIGNIYPIAEIGPIARERGIFFHVDAVQALGKLPIRVGEMGIDLMALSAHKLYAPKGVGALYIRRGVRPARLITGGHQERGRRGGTENVAGLVAFGLACEMAQARMADEAARLTKMRDRLWEGIRTSIPQVRLNGDPDRRLPGTLNVSFRGIEGESILLYLDMEGIAASSGSACTSGSLDPSHVLMALGMEHVDAHGSVRFSLGKDNGEEDIDRVLEVLPGIVSKLRSFSPLYEGLES